ncbi:MAG: transporter [bacterium]|nr:transporter [bacterium]
MKISVLTISVFFLNLSFLFAQYNETIRTGRPGQAIGAFTVGKNILQFQQGVDYNSYLTSQNKTNIYVSNNVIRYGIMETVELSALIDYQNLRNKSDSVQTELKGLSNLHLGFRVHVNNKNGWVPTTGFQMRVKMPNVSRDFGASKPATVMVFVANWSLPKSMSLASNWILSYNGNNPNATGKYVINLGFPIHKKLSGFIENYGQLSGGEFQQRFDGGFAYLLNNNVQLDLSAGYGNNKGIQDYFVSTGIS